jgi:hypothetical protein
LLFFVLFDAFPPFGEVDLDGFEGLGANLLVGPVEPELQPLAVDQPAHFQEPLERIDVPDVARTDLGIEAALDDLVIAIAAWRERISQSQSTTRAIGLP